VLQRALVTGASGFIGGHLTRALVDRGVHVRCLVRPTSNVQRLQLLDIELVQGQVHDLDSVTAALRGVDVVFNLAGLTCALRREELFRVNGEGPATIAAACLGQPTPPLHLLVSSIAASGPAQRGLPRTEQCQPRPVSHYGRSKLAGEDAVRASAADIPATIVRPGIVFGEHDPGMEPLLKTLYRLRLHLNAGLLSPRMSFISVHDLVDVLIRAAERGERLPADAAAHYSGQGVYFGVVPEYPTYAELGTMLAAGLHEDGRHWTLRIPSPLAWIFAGAHEAVSRLRRQPDIFNTDKIREALVASWVCSAEKTMRQLEFAPSAPLAQQLAETARLWVAKV
jgi:dihydroflavonol-4-reductase